MSHAATHPPFLSRAYSTGELLADGVVHVLALVAGLIAFPLLLNHALHVAGAGVVLALVVYAAGFFLMFGFSLAYNMVPPSALKWLLRRCDHSMIYVMIAGTYTAVLVQVGNPAWAWAIGGTVWSAALAGIAIKVVLPGRYDRLSILGYIVLGWAGGLVAAPAAEALPPVALWLLFAGGMTYVAGVGFFVWNRLRFQNAIWHLFVTVASGLHFAAIALSVAA